MATIEISRPHTLSKDDARQKAEELAKGMAEKLGIEWKWAGDTIEFHAPSGMAKGAKGQVIVREKEVRVEVDLPLMLRPMKGVVEGKIKERLDRLG